MTACKTKGDVTGKMFGQDHIIKACDLGSILYCQEERETDRDRDRETERDIQRQKDRDRATERHRDRQTDRGGQTDR